MIDESWPAETRRRPSAENARLRTAFVVAMQDRPFVPPGMSQSRIVPSSPPIARVCPSGEKARQLDVSVSSSETSACNDRSCYDQIVNDLSVRPRPEAFRLAENATAYRTGVVRQNHRL